ncbi:hypothetical protein SISNIDRAFT_508482 [Sistotremastrum niveocremeum HHB9708]|uniref:Elongator complex protein 5 n=1 Tax=Sistotremastrum niveocremeum HHB9708 TaxID=1314777 RepID=A0A164U703_9AGAM|nr:hypothetical protein SISNIDRAFT_508482 [Sistotremastrum niveocremeum HHB9708]
MSPRLSTLLSDKKAAPLLVIQWTHDQPVLPLLRYAFHSCLKQTTHALLITVLHEPKLYIPSQGAHQLKVLNYADLVPGYSDHPTTCYDIERDVFEFLDQSQGSITVMMDSVETLRQDAGSVSPVFVFLSNLMEKIRSRPSPSRMIIPIFAGSPLLPVLLAPGFNYSLSHVTLHSTAFITHIAKSYLTLPPPLSSSSNFWRLFIPMVERHEGEKIVFGSEGEGGASDEAMLEIVERLAMDRSEGKKSVERSLEGWNGSQPCEWTALSDLRGLGGPRLSNEEAPDPTKNISFNLSLTEEQQKSRSQVPLPYAHTSDPATSGSGNRASEILYDPDSADDIDDDDPDEDLDI